MINTHKLRTGIDNTLETWQWWLLAIASWAIFRSTMAWLETLYNKTLFPVSVIKGQTTFDGNLIKSYYSVLIENETLDKYLHVQLVDYGFMVTMFAAMTCMTIATYRSLPNQKHIKNVAWAIALIAPLAPMFDALENIVSFFMIANPHDFANWLAYPYSTFAVVKYVLSGLGFVWTVLGGSIALSVYLYTRSRNIISKKSAIH